MENIVAVILAGGLGTRVQHLLPNLPKPMAPVAGKPFLEWVVRYLVKQGIKKVIISTGYRAEVIENHFRSSWTGPADIRCFREAVALGTAGGFLLAARSIAATPEAWLVLNGDSLVFAEIAACADALSSLSADGVFVGCPVPDTSRYGSLEADTEGNLMRFAEKRPGAGVISAGVYLLRHSLLPQFPAKSPLSFEQDVFPALLAGGARFKVVLTNAPFLDIGTEVSLPRADSFVRDNAARFQA